MRSGKRGGGLDGKMEGVIEINRRPVYMYYLHCVEYGRLGNIFLNSVTHYCLELAGVTESNRHYVACNGFNPFGRSEDMMKK